MVLVIFLRFVLPFRRLHVVVILIHIYLIHLILILNNIFNIFNLIC